MKTLLNTQLERVVFSRAKGFLLTQLLLATFGRLYTIYDKWLLASIHRTGIYTPFEAAARFF